jgi:hypothetical protein
MRICSLLLGALMTMAVACAHSPAASDREGQLRRATSEEKVIITGSRIPQRLESSSGVPRSISPIRIYSREEITRTGRSYDLRAALGDLDPALSR